MPEFSDLGNLVLGAKAGCELIIMSTYCWYQIAIAVSYFGHLNPAYYSEHAVERLEWIWVSGSGIVLGHKGWRYIDGVEEMGASNC